MSNGPKSILKPYLSPLYKTLLTLGFLQSYNDRFFLVLRYCGYDKETFPFSLHDNRDQSYQEIAPQIAINPLFARTLTRTP